MTDGLWNRLQMDTWLVKFSWFDLLYGAVSQTKLCIVLIRDNHSALHVFLCVEKGVENCIFDLIWTIITPAKYAGVSDDPQATPLVYYNRPVKDHLSKFNQVDSRAVFFLNCEFEQYNPLIGEGIYDDLWFGWLGLLARRYQPVHWEC